MKKLSKKTRSALLNGLIIFLTIGIVFYLGATNGDLGDAWEALCGAKTNWVIAAAVSWCFFVIFEALGVHAFFRQQKIKIRFHSSLLVSLVGMFYSSVTPAATGGQPMQVFAFKKRGVPTGVSSSALTVKFFCFQVALLSMGTLLWALNPAAVSEYVTGGKVMVVTGFLLNGITVGLVLLLAVNKNIVRVIIGFVIRSGEKMHLIRHREKAETRAQKVLSDFRASVDMITHHPRQLFILLLISCVQVLGLMSIAYCVYRAMGLEGISYGQILTLQFLLYIGASFTPLPGASGAQEGGFYLFFQNIFPADKLLGALLLWRFFTYYLALLVGLGAVILNSAGNMRGKKNQASGKKIEEGETKIAEKNTESN